MSSEQQTGPDDGACTLCDVVKPDTHALRDHVLNIHPDDFCGLYHEQPCQHDRRIRYDVPIDRALRDAGIPPEARAVTGRAVSDAAMAVADAECAATLRLAAGIAESLRQFEPAFGARKAAQVSENVGILRVATELRRLAGEVMNP